MKSRVTIKRVLIFLLITLLIFLARPVSFLLYINYKDKKFASSFRSGFVNDASKLNDTKVASVVPAHQNIDSAIFQISELIIRASAENKKISIAGAQHSMGGHTIYPDAIVLDMKTLHYMKYDSVNSRLLVSAGTLWSEIIPYLDQFGKAVAVMQSNNSFSVGGSISVNCHGWQPNSPPIASTVQSFRLIDARGKIISCSRTENQELFSLVLGGYGLFGVILDVELNVVDNQTYTARQFIIPSEEYVKKFGELVANDPTIGLAYGRININPSHFMEEAILSTYKTNSAAAVQHLKANSLTGLRRTVFRSSANSDYGKNLRWKIEKASASLINGREFSRNQLSNEGVEIYQNQDTGYTDILHEYFIPKNAVPAFIDSLKKIIPVYKVDLLNITLRNVKQDRDAFLAYANEEVFGFVMLFNQRKENASENEMRALTQHLINVATDLQGKYYLPYRLHATKQQMRKAYSTADSFFILKKKYDPAELFTNKFYETYK